MWAALFRWNIQNTSTPARNSSQHRIYNHQTARTSTKGYHISDLVSSGHRSVFFCITFQTVVVVYGVLIGHQLARSPGPGVGPVRHHAALCERCGGADPFTAGGWSGTFFGFFGTTCCSCGTTTIQWLVMAGGSWLPTDIDGINVVAFFSPKRGIGGTHAGEELLAILYIYII